MKMLTNREAVRMKAMSHKPTNHPRETQSSGREEVSAITFIGLAPNENP